MYQEFPIVTEHKTFRKQTAFETFKLLVFSGASWYILVMFHKSLLVESPDL